MGVSLHYTILSWLGWVEEGKDCLRGCVDPTDVGLGMGWNRVPAWVGGTGNLEGWFPPPPPPPEDQLPVVGTGHTTFPQTVLLSIWLGEFGHFCVPYGGNVGLPFKSLQDGNRLDVLSQCLQVSLLEAAGGALQYSWGKWPLLDQTEMHLVCGNWLLPPCL